MQQDLQKNMDIKLKFRIYRTKNGYHIFITSHIINYSFESFQSISQYLGCDSWYILYCKYHGFCVRLSPKLTEDYLIHEFVCDYGIGLSIDYCNKMIDVLDKIIP